MTLNLSKCKSNLQVALDNAAEAEVSNRGMYPFTAATNVFKIDGTPLEEKLKEEESETTPGGGEETTPGGEGSEATPGSETTPSGSEVTETTEQTEP